VSAVAARSRRHAREAALRILYQAEVNGEPIDDATEQIVPTLAEDENLRAYVVEIVAAVDDRREEIDARLRAASTNWSLERMATVDRNVLRLGVAELLVRPDVDARVVIDEAVSIAEIYGTDDSGRFVNGILDRLARELRPGELES
jgi:N utilization substance protein B